MNRKQLLLVFLILWYSKFFSWMAFPINETLYGQISHIIEFLILVSFFVRRQSLDRSSINFSKPVMLMVLVPLLSIIPAIMYEGQSLSNAIINMTQQSMFLLYFTLHIIKLSKKELVQIIMTLGIVYCLIKVAEQITYPTMYFCQLARIDKFTGDVEMRNGFWRIIIAGGGCATIMTYMCFERYINERKTKLLIFVVLGLASIFLNLSRIGFVSCLLTMILIYMKDLSNTKNLSRLFGVAIVGVIIMENLDILVGADMLGETSDQLNDDDYVRWIAYDYFFHESLVNPIVFLLGHGPIAGTALAEELAMLIKEEGLYLSDIGIVGELYTYGLVFCIAEIYFFIYIMKRVKKVRWLFAYLLPSLVFLIMIPKLTGANAYINFSIMLYLADLQIREKELSTI